MNPLRKLLLAVTFAIAMIGPFLDGTANVEGWRIFPTVIAPAIMLMLVFILPLDMTMARVFMTGADDSERQRLQTAIRMEAWSMVVLLIAWMPFYLRFFEISLSAGDG